jgi:inosose dehydratase
VSEVSNVEGNISRRGLLGSTAGLGVAGVLSGVTGVTPALGANSKSSARSEWKVALNQIQWMASPDGLINPTLLPPFEQILRLVASAGFDAFHPDIPSTMSPQAFLKALRRHGLKPSSGYMQVGLSDQGFSLESNLKAARETAKVHRALGQKTVFISAPMTPLEGRIRLAQPARGAGFDQNRLEGLTDMIRRVARELVSRGVRPALHPHVGTWIETEREIRHVLDNVSDNLLDFGPDVGHMTWAGMDAAQVMRRYRNRIAGMHVKDIRADIAAQSRTGTWTYGETVLNGVYIEPGRGDIDLDAVFAALPRRFNGWIIVENDRPDLPVWESAVYSAAWMRMNLPGAERENRRCD